MAISRDKLIIGGVVVLGALSFGVYRLQKQDQTLGSGATKLQVPDVKGTDDLDKLEITNADKGTITLEKQGDKWMVTKPLVATASQTNVKQLLDNVKELKATEVVAATPDDEVTKSYALDPAHAVHFVGYKAGDKKVDDWFGKSGGRGEIMRVEGKPQIIAATGYASYLYTRDVLDWRDRDIFRFDDANATSVTIENANGKFSFTKGDKWSGTLNGHPIPNFDDMKVADSIRSMKNLIAESFPDPKTPAESGLDKPAVFTVALKDNAGTYTLKVGGVSSGTSHYAMPEGGTTLITVNPNVSDWATANAAKFAKTPTPDGGAPTAANKPQPKFPR